ncbi:MAG TPA: 2Fe-2S iron-sulfur cluster-binding protein [Chryseolinea sp.]|nr:2Fe-2S iron-sulfur cluster-binding protein [Chryseolinea sp.]
MITFQVEDIYGRISPVEVPDGIQLSLMEVLKASDYPIEATCGGIALCATCHVRVNSDTERLNKPTATELDMIDTLPNAHDNSRLACQIPISPRLEGAVFSLRIG